MLLEFDYFYDNKRPIFVLYAKVGLCVKYFIYDSVCKFPSNPR